MLHRMKLIIILAGIGLASLLPWKQMDKMIGASEKKDTTPIATVYYWITEIPEPNSSKKYLTKRGEEQ